MHSKETQEIARHTLKILGFKGISEDEDAVKVLANFHFPMMCSIDFDIMETIRELVSLLQQGKTKEALYYVKKLEHLIVAREFE
jgi:hypothetical protein